MYQSASTVLGEMARLCAASSHVKPPKNRSSTTRALRSSRSASFERASSRSRKSTSGSTQRDNVSVAHHRRGDAKEVCPIERIDGARFDELQVRLMNEGGRLQGVVRTLAAHVARCQLPELLVDQL